MQTATIATALLGAESRRTRSDVMAAALSVAPVVLLVAVGLTYGVTKLAAAPGLPLLVAVTLVWTAMGALVVRESGSTVARTIALAVFTAPATVAAVVGPLLALVGPAA